MNGEQLPTEGSFLSCQVCTFPFSFCHKMRKYFLSSSLTEIMKEDFLISAWTAAGNYRNSSNTLSRPGKSEGPGLSVSFSETEPREPVDVLTTIPVFVVDLCSMRTWLVTQRSTYRKRWFGVTQYQIIRKCLVAHICSSPCMKSSGAPQVYHAGPMS